MPAPEFVRQNVQGIASVLNSHRFLVYATASLIALAATIANALVNYSNFYSIAVFLSKSSRSVLILANFGVLIALLSGRVVQHIFFGPLRPTEVERLYDRLWYFMTESLLAFTIFRDEFDIPFGLMFGFLLFVKSFHWLSSDRIEWMEQRQYPGPPPLFHFRMATLFLILWLTDFVMFAIAVESSLATGVGGMVIFACEYAILMASLSNTVAKYILTTYELRRAGARGGENAPPWEGKSMWVFYIELATDFLKLSTYLVFFTVIVTFHGLPLNMIRDVYITASSFITRLRALQRYQTATRNMDTRYPSPTEAELAAMSDRTCIICREEIVLHGTHTPGGIGNRPVDGPNMTPKKLPCGHIFHFHCLRSWLERQQSCPTCRRSVLEQTPAAPQQPGLAALQPGLHQGAAGQFGGNAGARPGGQENNNLGFLGRFLGGAAQAPLVPGQFANMPNLRAGVANAGIAGGNANQAPRDIVVQYHIQLGQPAAQQDPVELPGTPIERQELRPAPRLDGFRGPGGNIQRWEMDERWFNDNVNPVEPPHVNEPNPNPSQANNQSLPSTTSAQSPPISRHQSSGYPTDVDFETTQTPLTPREASAQAALRRISSSAQRNPERRSLGNPQAGETQNQGTTSAVRAVSPSQTSYNLPRLIPLYGQNLPGVFPQPASSQTTPSHSSASQSRPGTTSSSLPLSADLPQSLTDQQLRSLDRLTREAIDERLRVLEGVSGTVNKCIEELIRMRSVLPQDLPATETTQVPQGTVEAIGSSSSNIEPAIAGI